jgi:hypothetical protein
MVSPGRARNRPLKPLRREGRTASAEPVCSCAFFYRPFAHETAGAARTRSSLRPLIFGANDFAKLGRMLSRDREVTFSCDHPRRRMIQYSRASVMETKSRGVLDPPVKPGDDGGGRSIVINVIARSEATKQSSDRSPHERSDMRVCRGPAYRSAHAGYGLSTSLRAKRSNPEPPRKTGLLRRCAPRNDGVGIHLSPQTGRRKQPRLFEN